MDKSVTEFFMKNLKSNMDRFIATKNTDNNSFKVNLKSNMDRFIVETQRTARRLLYI